jgi:hypothetical protein
MPKAKFFSRDQILEAMDKTKSIKAAARYLNCSYQHLKPFMKRYTHPDTGETLFDMHKNQCGRGIPKFITHSAFNRKEPAIIDIVEGRVDPSHFSPEKLRYRMIEAGLLEEKCTDCGFEERRITDYKMPLIMRFKDGDTRHYGLGNVQLLCYNCYFLNQGDVFNKQDLHQLETHTPTNGTTDAIEFELDDFQIQQLEKLGLYQPPKAENDGSEFISRL